MILWSTDPLLPFMPNPDMHNKSAMAPDSAGIPRSSVLMGRLAGGWSHMVPVGHVKIRNKGGRAMTAEKLGQTSQAQDKGKSVRNPQIIESAITSYQWLFHEAVWDGYALYWTTAGQKDTEQNIYNIYYALFHIIEFCCQDATFNLMNRPVVVTSLLGTTNVWVFSPSWWGLFQQMWRTEVDL